MTGVSGGLDKPHGHVDRPINKGLQADAGIRAGWADLEFAQIPVRKLMY